MQWDDSFLIGIEKIDKQHQKLFTLVSRLEETVGHPSAASTLGATLKALVDYTNYHFNDEENLMHKIHYIDANAHKQLHQVFINNVRNTLIEIKKGRSPSMTDLIGFINQWIIEHIKREDTKIGHAFQNLKRKIQDQADSAGPQRHSPAQELTAGLKKLSSLLNQKRINAHAFTYNKQQLMDTFRQHFSPIKTIEMVEELNILTAFFDTGIMDDDEKAQMLKTFANKIDLAFISNQDEAVENTLAHLEILFQQQVIADHEYALYKDHLVKKGA